MPTNKKTYRIGMLIVGAVALYIVYHFIFSTPNRMEPVVIHITPGESLNTITRILEEKSVVRSAAVLQSVVIFFNGDRQIAFGDYAFDSGTSLIRAGWMLAHGIHHVAQIKVTFPEGMTNTDMAELLAEKIPLLDRASFELQTKTMQGYLFPDTYFFYPLTTVDEIISALSGNFKRKINTVMPDITSSGKSVAEIITMASVIEHEAHGTDDAALVAGILWKRIDTNMLLQVDAAPETYKKLGLPSEPIDNPGLASIRAALHPTASPYLYYLHDKSGMIHFARTYAEHKRNITKYLK